MHQVSCGTQPQTSFDHGPVFGQSAPQALRRPTREWLTAVLIVSLIFRNIPTFGVFGVELASFGIIERSNVIRDGHSPLAQVIGLLLGSAWIIPSRHSLWLIPAATLILLVPFFFASYAIEYRVIKSVVGMPEGSPNLAYPRVRIAVRNANLVTYGVMFVATSVWLLFSFVRR